MSWDEWFRRRRRFPFDVDTDILGFPSSLFSRDIDEVTKDLEKRMEEVFKDLTGKVPESLVRERKLSDGRFVKEMGPFVYGYSVTVEPDGKPALREFGNLRPSSARPGLDVQEKREPLVDIFSTNGEVKAIAELPGVEKGDVRLCATEKVLTISVDTPKRKYHKELDLPAEVDAAKAKSTYRNGVLEVTLPKLKPKKPKGDSIRVE